MERGSRQSYYKTARAPAKIAPRPTNSALPAAPELAAAAAVPLELAAELAVPLEPVVVPVFPPELDPVTLAAALLAEEMREDREDAALPVVIAVMFATALPDKEMTLAEEERALEDVVADAVDAHVAAEGRLETPCPAQMESANWMVAGGLLWLAGIMYRMPYFGCREGQHAHLSQ